MICPECGNHRGNPSVHYPWLDLAKIFPAAIEKRLRNGRAKDFTWEEFVEVRKEIRRHLTPDLPLPPAAEFGSFVGKIFAKPPATDFVLTVSFKLLARRNVIVELKRQGFDLQFFETVLKQQKDREEDYVQVYPVPAGSGGPSSGSKFCSYCERGRGRDKFIIQKPDPDLRLDLFLLKDENSPIIFSERLVQVSQRLGFSGLQFDPVSSE